MFSAALRPPEHCGVWGVLRTWYWSPRFCRNITIFLVGIVATGIAAVVLSLESPLQKLCGSPYTAWSDAERETLMRVLRELSRRFFHLAREISSLARSIRAELEGKGASLDEGILCQEMSKQCQVEQQLAAIQADVLACLGISEEFVREAQERFQDDAEVHAHIEGTQHMFHDALRGIAPVLPGVKIPDGLSEDKVIQIHCKMQRLKIDKATQLAPQAFCGQFSNEKLGQALAMLSEAAESQILEIHRDITGQVGELYQSAMATYLRSPTFKAHVARLDEDHKRQMIAVFTVTADSADLD